MERNASSLTHFLSTHNPLLVFLSEPQAFSCDIAQILSALSPTYSYHLNGEDSYSPDLPLTARRSFGGTLAIWHSAINPFVTLLPTSSPAILPLHLAIPGLASSTHIGVYLPTAGKDPEFLSALADLEAVTANTTEMFGDSPVFFRGDFNVNPKNKARLPLLTSFIDRHALLSIDAGHPTHHHFVGDGSSDSQLDLLLHSSSPNVKESLSMVICKLSNPLVASCHDILLSVVTLPTLPTSPPLPHQLLPVSPMTVSGLPGTLPHTRSSRHWSPLFFPPCGLPSAAPTPPAAPP